nr:uncharacterized protein LOC109159120 [Ipomoea batatas]
MANDCGSGSGAVNSTTLVELVDDFQTCCLANYVVRPKEVEVWTIRTAIGVDEEELEISGEEYDEGSTKGSDFEDDLEFDKFIDANVEYGGVGAGVETNQQYLSPLTSPVPVSSSPPPFLSRQQKAQQKGSSSPPPFLSLSVYPSRQLDAAAGASSCFRRSRDQPGHQSLRAAVAEIEWPLESRQPPSPDAAERQQSTQQHKPPLASVVTRSCNREIMDSDNEVQEDMWQADCYSVADRYDACENISSAA